MSKKGPQLPSPPLSEDLSEKKGRGTLLSSERLLLFSFFLLLATLLLLAKYHHHKALTHLSLSPLASSDASSDASSPTITVQVTGAIAAPQQITLPAGSRLCDLKSKIVLTEKTDKQFLRRKRPLRNGEEIVIPEKKSPSPPPKS